MWNADLKPILTTANDNNLSIQISMPTGRKDQKVACQKVDSFA